MTCEELQAAYDAAETDEERAEIEAQMIAQGCMNQPQGGGAGAGQGGPGGMPG